MPRPPGRRRPLRPPPGAHRQELLMSTALPEIVRRNHGRGHSYRINGNKVPGVTTILGGTTAKPGLINWAGDATAGYAVDHWDELRELPPTKKLAVLKQARYADRDAAANRGTEVHRLAEAYMNGEEITVPDELEGHVQAY